MIIKTFSCWISFLFISIIKKLFHFNYCESYHGAKHRWLPNYVVKLTWGDFWVVCCFQTLVYQFDTLFSYVEINSKLAVPNLYQFHWLSRCVNITFVNLLMSLRFMLSNYGWATSKRQFVDDFCFYHVYLHIINFLWRRGFLRLS